MNEGYQVVLNASGGVDRAHNAAGKMTSSGGVYEDKLVVVPPVEGVLNRDVRHT